jgi:hypothetical protein
MYDLSISSGARFINDESESLNTDARLSLAIVRRNRDAM